MTKGFALQFIDSPAHPQLSGLRSLLVQHQCWLGFKEIQAYIYNLVKGVKYMALELHTSAYANSFITRIYA